jgi:prepilin-type processing-associated H-X9-DG protein
MLVPAVSNAKQAKAVERCTSNLETIGMAFKQWAVDHEDQFPWGISITNGGTMELSKRGVDNLDPSPIHFEVISNELESPRVLICPADSKHKPVFQFRNLRSNNVSYELHTGSRVSETNADQVLAVCPIHGNVLMCDGSVEQQTPRKRNK